MRAFADNREALNKVPETAAALAELTQIRDNSNPYGQINRIEPLLANVTKINEQLAQQKREKALLSIDAKIAEVQAKLDATKSAPDVSNNALRALQSLKTRIATQSSIAQILYLQGQGGDAMDEAIALIEAAVAAATAIPHVANPSVTSTVLHTGQPNVTAPIAKTPRVIRASDFTSKTYLETEADVDDYLAKLKAELMSAINAGTKARVQ